jgi:hypothetical protein
MQRIWFIVFTLTLAEVSSATLADQDKLTSAIDLMEKICLSGGSDYE